LPEKRKEFSERRGYEFTERILPTDEWASQEETSPSKGKGNFPLDIPSPQEYFLPALLAFLL
jgi:hypothetical protein